MDLTVSIDRDGVAERTLEHQSADDLVRLVEDSRGARDITIAVQAPGLDEELLVAIDRSRAFLALVRPDGILQFSVPGSAVGQAEFIIGHQPTFIDLRYVLDLPNAASVIREWIAEGEVSAHGFWERR